MVRRLIRNFLRWLRQRVAQLRKIKHRQLSSPQPLLEPIEPDIPVHQMSAPSALMPPQREEQPQQEHSFIPQHLSQHTRVAKALPEQLTIPSNFKMRLSEYRYSPSAAIQGLRSQLSQIKPTATEKPIVTDNLDEPESVTEQRLQTDYRVDQLSQLDNPNSLSFEEAVDEPLEPLTEFSSLSIENSEAILKTQQAPTSSDQAPPMSALPETISAPDVVVKQGTVKLLFKLKKNNHHGYITPHDGSKDIIFHQKYVGHDVFSRLERGMEVEVAAHITEGKAYADRIRII